MTQIALPCLFVCHFISTYGAFTCDELASSVSTTCLKHLVETKGYIHVNKEGVPTDDVTNALHIGYREYYHDSVSPINSTTLTPILLVHGGPAATSMYLDTMKYLSCTGQYRVIFYDQLCVGMSANTVNPKCNNISTYLPSLFTMKYYSNEMFSVIQDRIDGNMRYHLLGQSAGGLLITQFAIDHIEYINSGKVISIIYANSVTHSIPEYIDGVIKEIIPSLPKKYRDAMLSFDTKHKHFDEANNFFTMKHIVGLSEYPDCVSKAFNEWNFEIYSNLFAECEWCPGNGEMSICDLSDNIKDIKLPIFAYRGEMDSIVEKQLTDFQKKATSSDVTLYTIKYAAHCSHIDHFDEWYSMMNQWLQSEKCAQK